MTDTAMPTDLPIYDGTNPAHRLADDLRRGRIPGYAAGDVRAVLTMLAASPQGENSSGDADTPQPDALPGDLREKVARIVDPAAFLFASDELMKCDPSRHDALARADAILSLIQSERGGA